MNDEAIRIKDRLRSCASPEEVEKVAHEERATVREMHKADEGKPLAIQIANLKAYTIDELERVIE